MICLDGSGFYAIVRMWNVTIDCFTSFQGTSEQTDRTTVIFSHLYAVKQKAWHIPKIFFTNLQQQPLPGVRTLGLGQNVSLEMHLVHRLLIFSDNIGGNYEKTN